MIYARELARIRMELVELCGLADLSGLEVVFAASGTDIHLLAAQLIVGDRPSFLRAIIMEPAETGSGVPAALAGRHFSSWTAFGVPVAEGASIDGTGPIDVVTVLCRKPDGTLRSESAVAGDIARLAENAAGEGKRVLLTIVDVSKTGLIVPSPAVALELRDRMPETVQLLVDACQFRLAPDTLRAYLERGCLVALTGSKFVTGPAFSGALLVPESLARPAAS